MERKNNEVLKSRMVSMVGCMVDVQHYLTEKYIEILDCNTFYFLSRQASAGTGTQIKFIRIWTTGEEGAFYVNFSLLCEYCINI